MAQLGQTFNQNEMPESQNNFDPIPAGWYSATIAGAELKDTKSGTGQYINVRYDITGPSYEGRVVFGMLNIRNQNPTAEQIGHQQLGELMRAIGLAAVQDTDQLIGGSCMIKVKVRAATDQYEASNEVAGWRSIEGSSAPKPAPTQQTEQAPAKKAPWQK